MFVLSPLGDVSSFRRKGLKNEVYLITEDKCIECVGVLLAARSPVISELLETSQNIPATEFSDNVPGLEDCLDLIYGSSIQIGDRNYKTIYKFGKIFQIKEMMDGILSWATEDLDCEKFWEVYLELITLNVEKSAFHIAVKKHLSTNSDTFLQCATQVGQSDKADKSGAVTELLSEILDKRILNFMMNICETELENDPMASSTASSPNSNKFITSATSYIENYVKSDQYNCADKTQCIQFLEKVSKVSNNVALVRTVLTLIINVSSGNLQPDDTESESTMDLNPEIVNKLTDQETSYSTVQFFLENTPTEMNPCIVGEILLHWEEVRFQAALKKPLFQPAYRKFSTSIRNLIESTSKHWCSLLHKTRYYRGFSEEMKGKFAESPEEHLHYCLFVSQKKSPLRCCIAVGNGAPINLPKKDLKYSHGMAEYAESIPAFRYNPNVVPQYGNIKGHWFLITENNNYVSFITQSQQHILQNITNCFVYLVYVPLDCDKNE